MLRIFRVGTYLHIFKIGSRKMIILTVLILFPFVKFINTFSIFYNNGFEYLTENLHQLTVSADLSTINTRWIMQKVDHFDDKSKTWKMRYFENLKFYQEKGPIYIYLGGEGEASPRYLSAGVIYHLAKETNGAMFMTEHRYYGKSLPFDDILVNVKHMKWLTSRQALADIAQIIKNIKANPIFKFSKVVIIGGSYAGNLAAWSKLLYSDLVDAAIASSGPVLAKKDFFEYIEKVNEDYGFYGTPHCLDTIRMRVAKYEEMLQTSEGIEELKGKFNICPDVNMSIVENQWVFFTFIMDKFMENSQYGNPQMIKEHCLKLENSAIYNISNKMLWNARNDCFDFTFDTMIKSIKTTNKFYSWIYQTCTEFGYFQTTSSDSQPFGNVLPLEYFIKTCVETFGPDFNEDRVKKAVEDTNKMYGGLKPNVTRVVFSNGDMDPWSTLSMLEDLSYEAPSVLIPRASHCADLFPEKPDATEEIKEAAKYIKYLIKHWIGLEDNSVA